MPWVHQGRGVRWHSVQCGPDLRQMVLHLNEVARPVSWALGALMHLQVDRYRDHLAKKHPEGQEEAGVSDAGASSSTPAPKEQVWSIKPHAKLANGGLQLRCACSMKLEKAWPVGGCWPRPLL